MGDGQRPDPVGRCYQDDNVGQSHRQCLASRGVAQRFSARALLQDVGRLDLMFIDLVLLIMRRKLVPTFDWPKAPLIFVFKNLLKGYYNRVFYSFKLSLFQHYYIAILQIVHYYLVVL